jgi:hypothetical protein
MATVRHHVMIDVSAPAAWELLGTASRLGEWFPGVVACDVEGSIRTVTLATGLTLPEEIVTVDELQRRFQYTLKLPIITQHLSTIDVIEIDADRCCCIYGVDATPAVMALVVAGAAAEGLDRAKALLEGA